MRQFRGIFALSTLVLLAACTKPAGDAAQSGDAASGATTVATVNGKKNSSAKGAKTKVTLRGLPKGTVKVTVTATLTTGRKLTVKRTYKTCAK